MKHLFNHYGHECSFLCYWIATWMDALHIGHGHIGGII